EKELAAATMSGDAWLRTHARRLAAERGVAPALVSVESPAKDSAYTRLWMLWAEHSLGGTTDKRLLEALKSTYEYERAWAIQFAAEKRSVSEPLRAEFARLAKEDPSPVVRLYLASAAQRIPIEQRLAV